MNATLRSTSSSSASSVTKSSTRSSFRKTIRRGVFVLAGAGLLASTAQVDATAKTSRAKRPTTTVPSGPATGRLCNPLGTTAHANGTRFDCVLVGSAKQWHPRGSKANPLDFEETVTVGPEYSRWNVAVIGVEDDYTAKALAPDSRNVAPKPGSQYVGLHLRLTYVGPEDQAMVRQGVDFKAFTASRGPIDRATPGAATEDDCWVNETVLAGTSKDCVMPYEIPSGELTTLGFFAAKPTGSPAFYFES